MEDQCHLSASKILKSHKPLVKKPIKKKKIHLARKTIRQLLKKQSSLSRNHEADFFSILELNAHPLKCQECYSRRIYREQESYSRDFTRKVLRARRNPSCGSITETDLVSPPVLKQVKNMALHEKYLDHLHKRDVKRRKLKPPSRANKVKVGENVDVVGAAKSALILDAKDVSKQFQLMAEYDRSPLTEIEDDRFEIKDDYEEIDILSDTHQH